MLLSPAFLPPLLGWYERNKRDLPWRRDREPYHVWLSEIMLQQTRVEAVKGYYARFLAELPDIPSLAACDPDRLHKLWEGLGYYSRVRNLQKAAQQIVSDYGGAFPTDYDKIRALQRACSRGSGSCRTSTAFWSRSPRWSCLKRGASGPQS